jgi:polysaccharide export outer membrane protein
MTQARDRSNGTLRGAAADLHAVPRLLAAALALGAFALGCAPARPAAGVMGPLPEPGRAADSAAPAPRAQEAAAVDARSGAGGTQIGPNDQLEIAVFEAPELKTTARVAESGLISLPLLGEVKASGLTPRELEVALETSLREKYILDPHVTVQVSEMQSRGISVVGAVARPGVFQIRESRSLLEVIALAGGLTKDAGEGVIVMRADSAHGAGRSLTAEEVAARSIEINLKALLNNGDPSQNIPIYPGDLVKVRQAGLIYVVGEVGKPGAFPLDSRSGLTMLQAIAMGEGVGSKAAQARVVIIRTTEAGQRVEIPVDLEDAISGKVVDPPLQPRDVVYVPKSMAKTVTYGTIDMLVRMVTLRGIF